MNQPEEIKLVTGSQSHIDITGLIFFCVVPITSLLSVLLIFIEV